MSFFKRYAIIGARRFMPFIRWRGRLLLQCTLVALLSACASWQGKPIEVQYDSDATRSLMEQTMNANQALSAFKGIGRMVVDGEDGTHIFDRTAWVGSTPGRLRFAFRSPAGMPVFSMSCDEQWVTALNHSEGKYYRRQIGNNSLSSFLPVEIKCADLFAILAGRPPQVPYDYARVASDTADDADTIMLILQRRFRGTVARIRIDRATGDLRVVEIIDVHGNRLYEAKLNGTQMVNDYRLPGHIELIGPDGRIELDIKRLWTEAAVDQNLFQIKPPAGN